MKNCFFLKGFNFEGKTGFALSVLVWSLAHPVTAEDTLKSGMPYQKAVAYKVKSNGSLGASVVNTWSQPLVVKTTLSNSSSVVPSGKKNVKDEIERLRLENVRLRLRIDELAKEMRALKYKTNQLDSALSGPALEQQQSLDDLAIREFPGDDFPDGDESGHKAPEKTMPSPGLASRKASREFDTSCASLEQEELEAQEGQMIPYAHHVVYIFKNKEDQQRMWSLLSEAGEDDRWQGANTLGTRHFIYTGAFQNNEQAQKRALQIKKITGIKPVVYFQV